MTDQSKNIDISSNNDFEITSDEVRKKFVAFWVKKNNHAEIPSVSLLPDNDPTLLFVNSGMFPLVPYLLWEKHAQWTRLVNYQRCFRSDDIEEVWDHRHTTCFEMLWNWSLWDYFKKDQIKNRYAFLVKEIGLDPKRLYQSVYAGDEKVPTDEESISTLKEVFSKYGVSNGVWEATTGKWDLWTGNKVDFEANRIFPYRDKNRRQRGEAIGEIWWPDTETFYDTGKKHDPSFGKHCHVNCDCGRFIEIGNSVFIQYILTQNGREQIEKKNVDFWGWLERITMVANGISNIFESDIFLPYVKYIETKTGKKYKDYPKAFEIITDHLRASVFLIMDGCFPSNKDQWYYLRRLLRSMLVQNNKIGLDISDFPDLIHLIIEKLKPTYTQLESAKENILETMMNEAEKFEKVLKRWMKEFEKLIKNNSISGEDIFKLQATHGLPFEVIVELWKQRWIHVDEHGYHKKRKEHKEISRQWAEKKFKSGLADNSEQTTKLHTATHLLHASLKRILWNHVAQKGSNITPERLRFDFSHPKKMTPEQKEAVTTEINKIIQDGFTVKKEEMNVEDAKTSGAIGLFDDKYDGKVSVFTIIATDGSIVSKEICTGPHVENSEWMWIFKIKKEESSSGGVRRIKAVLMDG